MVTETTATTPTPAPPPEPAVTIQQWANDNVLQAGADGDRQPAYELLGGFVYEQLAAGHAAAPPSFYAAAFATFRSR